MRGSVPGAGSASPNLAGLLVSALLLQHLRALTGSDNADGEKIGMLIRFDVLKHLARGIERV